MSPSHDIAPVRQAVFLVGGKGTRLGGLTANTPKPLLELAPGLRFLDVLIEGAARQGFNDIILLAGHLGEQVVELYDGRTFRGARISVIREPEPAGTGGALRFAADRLAPFFMLANGDSFFDINWRALAAAPDPAVIGQLALRHVPDTSRYGAVELDGQRINQFVEKKANAGAGLISGGIYLLNRQILDLISGPCSIESEIFPALVTRGALQGSRYDGYFLDIGLPDTFAQARLEIPALRRRPAAFLDRDGVINVDRGYTHRAEDLEWIHEAPVAIRRLNDAGYLVIVVTNQAGVARGYYQEEDVRAFHEHMQDELARHGAHVDAFYYCPYHDEAEIPAYRVQSHPDRKPNPGMIVRAFEDWPIKREASFLIGDKPLDMEAAARGDLPAYLFEGGSLLTLIDRVLLQNTPRKEMPISDRAL